MKAFDAALVAELTKEVVRPFFLFEMQLTETWRYNDIDIDIYDDSGNKFSPVAFEFGNISGSYDMSVESIDININDTDRAITTILLGEDVRNKTAILYFGAILSTGGIKYQEFMRGIIGGWELYDDNKAKITITSEMVLWNKKSLRPQSSTCPWAFKGIDGECGYTGAETACDKSYDRCLELGNNANFGGDRFLPSIVAREIWWGKQKGG
jgi:hypothetical protein